MFAGLRSPFFRASLAPEFDLEPRRFHPRAFATRFGWRTSGGVAGGGTEGPLCADETDTGYPDVKL